MKRVFAAASILGTLAWFAVFWTSRHDAPEPPSPVLMVGMSGFLGVSCGVIASLVALVFRAVARPAPALSLALPGERARAFVRANHFKGWEGRGGTLHLTTHALHFVPHRFNFDVSGAVIDLGAIEEVTTGMHLLVTAGGHTHRFVVPDVGSVAQVVLQHAEAAGTGAAPPVHPPWVPVS